MAISNLSLEFNAGETRQCYSININQDDICEIDPNESFTVSLQYESGTQPILVEPDVADVLINDNDETECGESH